MTSLPHERHHGWHIPAQRLARITNLALPLVAGALATNLMTFVDTLMVGQLGNAALAGVGLGGQLFFLLFAVALGLAAGIQTMVARRVGEARLQETGTVLNAGILLSVAVGLALMALGYWLLAPVFHWVTQDSQIQEDGTAYLATRLPSLVLLGVNIAFRSYWVGVSLAKWSMVAIVSLSCANILFNYVLIFGHLGAPQLGVAGAGLGSTLAVLVGLLVNLSLALRFARSNGFLRRLPHRQQVRAMLKLSYPESLRQALFSLGVVLMYAIIAQLGARELAAFHVVISLCLVAYMPHIGLAGAATTLVSEALGRNDSGDAKHWGAQVAFIALLVLTLPAALVAMFAKPLLGWFLVDPATLALALLPLQFALAAHVLDGYSKVWGGALIGAGAVQTTLRLTLLPQWLLFLPLLVVAVFYYRSLTAAMGALLLSSIVAALLFVRVWQRGNWQGMRV